MVKPIRVLAEHEAPLESFHDCHVHGLHWMRDRFLFVVDIQYILEWIAPNADVSGYKFSICEARLVFRDADGVKVSLDWSKGALDSQIAEIHLLDSRKAPNGSVENHYEIEFSDPDGSIKVWSAGYEVALLSEPVSSRVTSISLTGET